MGWINYYSKYISDIAAVAVPSYALLQHDAKWKWSATCDSAYETLRKAVISESTLVHYQSSSLVVLLCDASSFGLGVALHHVMPDGFQRSIAFASKTLSAVE